MTSSALEAVEVTKRYLGGKDETVHVVDRFSAEIAHGEFVTLVGPSGCGKTTLLRILAGLISASEGSVSFAGTGEPVPPGKYGMAFQSPALLEWRKVLSNVLLPIDVLGRRTDADRERAHELLEMMGLTAFADRYPHELSGGMRQRAALARALVHDPAVLFMDEPFAALDALTREDLSVGLQRLHMTAQKTVVFVTHSIAEAVFLSDRVFVLSPRPARVIDEVRVDLPRPRDPAEQDDDAFRALEHRIRQGIMGRDA